MSQPLAACAPWMLVAAISLIGAGCQSQQHRSDPPPDVASAATATGPPASAAAGYLRWLDACLDQQRRQLDRISASADAAAAAFVDNERWSIGVIGPRGFTGEAMGRAGGIIRIHSPRQIKSKRWRGVILVGLTDQTLDASLAAVGTKQRQGCHIVVFGTPAQRVAADAADLDYDAFIENGAAPHNGLVQAADGRWLIPTQDVANVAVLWTWTGEFIAALTRRGRMAPVYMAYAVPGGQAWRNRIGMTKFHGPGLRIEPVGPGVLGGQFIDALGEDLRALERTQMQAIGRVAAQAHRLRHAGRGLYIFLHGHAIMAMLGGPHDPGYFTVANRGWFKLADHILPQPGDLLFCVGFDQLFDGDFFDGLATRLRKRELQLAWSVAVNNPQHDYTLAENELLIDQCWCFGDASVTVPGYPVRILPTSGVIAQAVVWMVNAELHAMIEK